MYCITHYNDCYIQATRDFSLGEYVVEYDGVCLDQKTAKIMEVEYSDDLNIGSYMYFFYWKGVKIW